MESRPFTALTTLFPAGVSPTRRAVLPRAGDVDGKRATLIFLVMELVNGTLRRFAASESANSTNAKPRVCR